MLGRSPSERKESPSQQKGLLTTRLLNALPYSNAVKNLYNNTKNANEVFKFGFNVAETCAGVVASPFISRYVALDHYAAEKWEQLGQTNLVSSAAGAIAYPFGFSLGLGQFARDKVVGIVTPALEVTYEWADVVIDNLLPPDSDESLEEEYRRMSSLQQKSPFRRVRERANFSSVIRVPSNALNFSWNIIASSLFMGLGLLNTSLSKTITITTKLVDTINLQFGQQLDHPWTVSKGDASKLYHAMVFHGAKRVNKFMAQLEHSMTELSEYLEGHKLPYNSQAVAFVANKLKDIEHHLVRIGGIQIEPSQTTIVATTRKQAATPRPRFLLSSTRKVRSPDDRLVLGIDNEEHIDPHKAELEALRMPSMMWGASVNKYKKDQRAKSHKDEAKKPTPKRAEATKVVRAVEEPKVDPNADEHGYILARPKVHDHLIPAGVAKQLGNQLLKRTPITPTNSPAEPLLNNPYSEISNGDDVVVRGPPVIDNAHEASVKEHESKAHEHHLRKCTLHEMIKEVAYRLEQVEDEPHTEDNWEVPKHPAHLHMEEPTPEPNPDVLPAPENNPYGKLADEDAYQDPLSIGMSNM